MQKFDVNDFEAQLSACRCDTKRIFALHKFIVQLKLKDIFARGFSLPPRMEAVGVVSKLQDLDRVSALRSLYEIILEAQTLEVQKYIIVFNADFSLPKSTDSFLGFAPLTSVKVAGSPEQEASLVFKFEDDGFFDSVKPYLKKIIILFDLLNNRIVHGTKTLLQKTDTGFQARNSGPLAGFFRKEKAEAKAFLNNDATSVLCIPPETNVTFPTADVTQIERAYIRTLDWLSAFYRIPNTKLFGQSPPGFQNTGNLEILNYEQSLDEIFYSYIKPLLEKIAGLLGETAVFTPISFYKLGQLDKLNNVLATTNSPTLQKYVENLMEALIQ